MKKFSILIAFILCGLFLLSGCNKMLYRLGRLGEEQNYQAFYILYVDNPFHTLWADEATKFDLAELVETDQYERKLFRYRGHISNLYGNGEDFYITSLVVCQQVAGDYAYYYEDYCWLTKTNPQDEEGFASFSDEEIALLKSRNDWDKELSSEKMRSVQYKNIKTETFPDYEKMKQSFCNYMEVSTNEMETFSPSYLERGEGGKQVVFIRSVLGIYICMIDRTDYSVIALEEYEGDLLQCQDAIHEFKEKHGFWDEQ